MVKTGVIEEYSTSNISSRNLDLYAGSGVSVMPTTEKSGDKIKTDKRFSGRYMIVTIAHKGTPDTMSSEMLLMKDAIL